MPGTEKLLERAYGDQLYGLGGPRRPQWAFRAFFLLMKENVLAFRRAPDRLTRYHFASAAYNGGFWIRYEARAAGEAGHDPWDWDTIFADFCGAVKLPNGSGPRTAAACRENEEYPGYALRYAPGFRGF